MGILRGFFVAEVASVGRSQHKRWLFVEEYIAGRLQNAKQAAIRAGYAPRSAHVAASRLLDNPEVQAAIKARIAEVCMGADEVLIRLAEQARAEYAAYLRADGTVDLARMLADGKGHLVKGTKWDRNGRHLTVEFYDAHAALVDIGKSHGLFVDKMALTDPTGTKEYGELTDERRLEALMALYERVRTRVPSQPADGDVPVDPAPGAAV